MSKMGPDVYRIRSISALIKHSLPNVIRRRRIFLFPKRNAPSPFTSRLWRCRLTFTKQPIPPNRSAPSRLSKASTTNRLQRPGNWRRSAACDLGWLQPSYSRKICWSFGRLGRFTLSLDLGRVAGHFPIVKIFGPLESFRDLVKSLTLRA